MTRAYELNKPWETSANSEAFYNGKDNKKLKD